jgi:hypothetical protein
MQYTANYQNFLLQSIRYVKAPDQRQFPLVNAPFLLFDRPFRVFVTGHQSIAPDGTDTYIIPEEQPPSWSP